MAMTVVAIDRIAPHHVRILSPSLSLRSNSQLSLHMSPSCAEALGAVSKKVFQLTPRRLGGRTYWKVAIVSLDLTLASFKYSFPWISLKLRILKISYFLNIWLISNIIIDHLVTIKNSVDLVLDRVLVKNIVNLRYL